jgi:protoporphyrinogen/coproporphyrinogen III oxidase
MKRVAVIGGGITGLSAAYALQKARSEGAPVDYVLYDSSDRLGGVLVTERVDGCLLEAGPDSFISEKPWAAELCRELGIADQLIGSNDSKRKTYILVRNRLIEMPDGLMFMVPTRIVPTVLSPLFSMSTKLRMAQEWFHPPHKANGDETVAALVERHYGTEMVDRLADPLLSGVYGGDSRELSVRAVLPRFADMEAKHGSLGRAMLAARRKMKQAHAPAVSLFTSLKDGMQQLVDTVVARLNPAAFRTKTTVVTLRCPSGSWSVVSDRGTEFFEAVILGVPTAAAGSFLRDVDRTLARELSEIRYSSSVTVSLIYDEKVVASLPPGFGFLVPRSEGKRMLACTFVHNKFPHRAPANRAIVRCFLGGSRDEAALDLSEAEILVTVRRELGDILNLTAEPLAARVYKWRAAMAQYGVGHLERLDRIEQAVQGTRRQRLSRHRCPRLRAHRPRRGYPHPSAVKARVKPPGTASPSSTMTYL